MSITEAIAGVAADSLIGAAEGDRISFKLRRNDDGTEVYVATLGAETLERVVGRDTINVRNEAGLVVARFAAGPGRDATVDCGGGPTRPTPDFRATKLGTAVSSILRATRKARVTGGVDVFASNTHATEVLYRERDGSAWYLLASRARRDEDRAEAGHSLGLQRVGMVPNLPTDRRDAIERGQGILMSLRNADGLRIATAWVATSGTLGEWSRQALGNVRGPEVVAMRLGYDPDRIRFRIPTGGSTCDDVTVHVDGEERYHNLFGPARRDTDSPSDRIHAIFGRRLAPLAYPAAAAEAAARAHPELAGSTPEATAANWLRERVRAEAAHAEPYRATAFNSHGEGYFLHEGGPTPVDLVERVLAAATMRNIEAISELLDAYIAEENGAERRPETFAEAAIARGYLLPETADESELARHARHGGGARLAERIEELGAEAAAAFAPAILAACYGNGDWNAVEALMDDLSAGTGPRR
jgi:hypothetical protein